MARLTLCLLFLTCCLVFSQASRVPFFSESWTCSECPTQLFRCKSSRCIVKARKYLYNGDAIWTRENQDEVRFQCHQGYQLRGTEVLPCDVCRNELQGIPPICEPVPTTEVGFGEIELPYLLIYMNHIFSVPNNGFGVTDFSEVLSTTRV
ncbi:hypothetical protein B566_EDAN005620 [Ephemera danica]|nr:hypothetical protein B566_EDAN005620 [Ephemera danica]